MLHALVVEDDASSRTALAKLVEERGFSTSTARDLSEARGLIEKGVPDLALLDLELPDGNGLELLESLNRGLHTQVVVVTGHATVDSAVNALHGGAVDYLTKPVDPAALDKLLQGLQRTLDLRRQVVTLRDELRKLGRFGGLVGSAPPMQKLYDLIARVAPTDSTVLIHGETGTGKELVAETIQRLSPRADKPFLPVNCGAIQPTLVESELFGHERGSFTGADRRRQGLFEQAHGGTLFLDEVTEMPKDLQTKLLRVLETGELTRVGGTERIEVDVRVIAATNRDPDAAMADGQLREDLYYRLMVFPLRVPPLRERRGDIELLADYVLAGLNEGAEQPKRMTTEALDRLLEHDWPGNVRELKNIVERACILARDRIGPECIEFPGDPPVARADGDVVLRIGTSIADAERQLVLATLETYQGDKRRAARILGISLKTLYNRLNKYGIPPAEAGKTPAAAAGRP